MNDPTYGKVMQAVHEQVLAARAEGKREQARHTLMKLRTLQVNATNERLTAESFREVATGILDDLVKELEKIS